MVPKKIRGRGGSLHWWSKGLILEMNLAPSKQATIMEEQGSNIKLVSKEVVQGLNLSLT
jgi:hypothetical protein